MATYDTTEDKLFYELNLDMSCDKATQTIRVKQQDADMRIIRIRIFENGEQVIFGGEYEIRAMFFVQRPDNTVIDSAAAVGGHSSLSSEDQWFDCYLTNEQISLLGRSIAYLRIYCGNDFICTQNINIDVEGLRRQGVVPISDMRIQKLSADEYEALARYDSNTLYVVIDYENESAAMYIGAIPISSGGGYNEVQSDSVSDEVEEVTT